MELLNIYTDGSCMKNPGGPGGWSFVVTKDGKAIYKSYGEEAITTNNRMELEAIKRSLIYANGLMENHKIVIYTDSNYCLNCITGKWKVKKNQSYFNDIYIHREDLKRKGMIVTFVWVRGHNGDKFNELADRLASKYKRKYSRKRDACYK